MAINTTTRQTTAFTTGNNFAFAFKVYAVGDVKVIQIQTSNGAETELDITTNYTVALNDDQDGNPGGTVTLVDNNGNAQNLATGYNIVITSKVSALQQTEITNQGGFFPEVINDVLDKAVILSQQQQNILDQTIRFPLTQSVSGLEITENATDRANKSFRFDNSGNLELYSPASVVQFTQAEKDKLAAIEASATADQSASEIRTLVESASDSNVFTDADHTKLNGIEASATADQTGAEIKTAYEAESNTNAFTDAEKTKLSGIAASANNYSISSDLLDEDDMASNSATKAASQQSIKAYVDANSGSTNLSYTANGTSLIVESSSGNNVSLPAATTSAWGVMSDEDKSKLDGIESGATGNQSDAEIKLLYEANSNTNAFTDADHSKLDGIEANADVTDATNVNAAGAIMNSDLDGKGELLVGDGNGDPAALSVGTNGYVLKANSNTSTGLEWAAESGGTDLSSGGTIDGDLTLTGANYNVVWDKSDNALEFADQAKATFGNSGQLEIYHQTTNNHSIIKETGSGSLIIQAENFDVQDTSGNAIISGFHDGQVRLSHHGDARLETTSTGIILYEGSSGSYTSTGEITSGDIGVTGNITVSGTVDGRDVATDGTKLDGIEANADVTDATNVDAAGAVMNSDLDGKGELLVGDGSGDPTVLAAGTNGYVLKANSSTASGLEWSAAGSGGDVNQNAFSNIAVSGQTTVAADSTTDTLNIAAGSNVTITTNASNDTVTIASTDTNTTYSVGDGGLTQNNFTDALKTKLDGIEASATADQTDAEIRAAVEAATDSNVFTDADHTKLNGIETSADVTDATNVAAAGALMDGDFTSNGFLKRTGAGSYTVDTSTYLQNLSEDTTPQLGGSLDVNGQDIVTTSNGDIELAPDGTGKTILKGNTNAGTLVFNCENNSHGQTVKSQPHSASVTNVLTLPAGADQEIVGTLATQTLTNKTLTSAVLNTGISGSAILDEDNMASNSATQLATQQSIKAYVDAEVAGAGGGGVTVQDEGSALSTTGTTLNFVGAGVTASGTGATKTITISGGGGGSGISNLVEDTTPQLGGNLDMQAYNVTGTGTVIAASTAVATAGFRKVYASTSAPTGSDGAVGDLWVRY